MIPLTFLSNLFQLCQLQSGLQDEGKGKYEDVLASVKEQHGREMAELRVQENALQENLSELKEKARHSYEISPHTHKHTYKLK